jgi:signal peptidase I
VREEEEARQPEKRETGKGGSRMRRLGRDAVSLAVFVFIALSARASLADHYVVPTGSMIPTVHEGDRVFVSKAAYGLRLPMSSTWLARWSNPKRGDVVVLESPVDKTVLLKRVVALPGDEVEVKDGHLVLNGNRVVASDHDETLDGRTHALSLSSGGGPDFGPAKVPEGKVLVMGDNRGNSRDGRMFGFVDDDSILGRALAVYSREGSLVWNEL